jgi:hypothetical protein
MLDLQQLQGPLEYKNQGNHQPRHTHGVRGQLHRGLFLADTQQVRPLVLDLHDHYRYGCACEHLAMSKEKPAK